jgi:hypothetical protein
MMGDRLEGNFVDDNLKNKMMLLMDYIKKREVIGLLLGYYYLLVVIQ